MSSTPRLDAADVRTGHVVVLPYGRRGYAFEVAYVIREWFTPPEGGPRRRTVWFGGWEILEHDPTQGRGPDTYRQWHARYGGSVIGRFPLYVIGDRRGIDSYQQVGWS